MSLWCTLPGMEELQSNWEEKRDDEHYEDYHDAIEAGLDKLKKYYLKFDDLPQIILSMCMFIFLFLLAILTYWFTVIHPYIKLDYIEYMWGGKDEQEAAWKAGDRNAKNWQDEAMKIVEATVCPKMNL